MESNYRDLLNICTSTLRAKEKMFEDTTREIDEAIKIHESLKKIHTILKEGSVLSQEYMTKYIMDLVSSALKTVFPESTTSFVLEYSTARDTQCKAYFKADNGRHMSLFDNDGYGALDIISIVLHAAYVMLEGSEKILLLDEPFRNLSIDRHEYAANMLYELSHQLRIQIVVNTHLSHIEKVADTVVQILYDYKNNQSIVTQYDN